MLYSEFSLSRYLQHRLLATGSSLIVYADPEDNILGIGLSADQREFNPSLWKGQNIYGLALMDVRNYLRKLEGRKS
uniref:NADAR domain-containing protein n=1 Tax=Tetranychus urticae TaxID=32264 RepID=T1JQU5_TETUR